jgi:decaprenylphospho-beta-D-erythro-pentofuranosid-2-ulose 2-reductase
MQDALGDVQSVLVLGGGSEIGLAIARDLVRNRTRTVVLAAREPGALDGVVKELADLGATRVETIAFDATAPDTHAAVLAEAWERAGDIDVAVVAFGVLGDQEAAARDQHDALTIATTNYTGAVSVGVLLAERLRTQGHGWIVALSSVAAERARASNVVYGSSKAGMDAFYTGLGDRLAGTGVRVMVVRPGFVRTRMTEGLDDAPLATTSEAVAVAVTRALRRGTETVWVPPAMRFVMTALRLVPRPIFRKLPI